MSNLISQFFPHSPFPSWCPYICSLHLCLSFCFVNKIIYTIFLYPLSSSSYILGPLHRLPCLIQQPYEEGYCKWVNWDSKIIYNLARVTELGYRWFGIRNQSYPTLKPALTSPPHQAVGDICYVPPWTWFQYLCFHLGFPRSNPETKIWKQVVSSEGDPRNHW